MKDDYTKRGFETVSVDALEEYRSVGLHLRHVATGAEVYKIHNDDAENFFAFAFHTPPFDSSGLPHILEHTVLNGSRRYPLKDPFRVLLNGSVHTFLNAITYPDKTIYPAASTVKADFLNLLRVYADAVFFPLLKAEAFDQEGHHLKFDDTGQLIRGGIVLNEMKGSYASPESVVNNEILHSLFPDSPYRWDSGGDPECIPSLTHQMLKEFHDCWYHPSNAKIFLYGNHDADEVLNILNTEFLGQFSQREIASDFGMQKRWDEPRNSETVWPSGDGAHDRSTISLNWLWGDAAEPMKLLTAQVLSFILLGHGGAPLQKAVIESGLGEDLSPVSGLETDLRQMVFSVALRGTEPRRRDDFESLVIRTLEHEAGGLDAQLVEGALRTVEFQAREIRGGAPFGIRLMRRTLRGWMHNKPPAELLVFEETMARLRRQIKAGFFEELIQNELLNNAHRSTVTVSPDPDLQKRRDAGARKELDQIRESLSPDDLSALQSSLERLERYQKEPDDPEDLARIPFLSRNDLPKEVRKIPLEEGRREQIRWYRHDAFTNGVTYLTMAFDLDGLDPKLHPWLPLFARAITEVGLPGRSYDLLARDLVMRVGGLACSLEASAIHPEGGGGVSLRFFVHLKALAHQWDSALDLVFKLLRQADFGDLGRVGDLLLELRNDYRSALLPSGHAFAALRASAKHSSTAPWEDLWYGVEQLLFLQNTAESTEAAHNASQALLKIRDTVMSRANLSLVITADAGDAPPALDKALAATEALAAEHVRTGGMPELFRHPTVGEGLAVPSTVSFSALSLPAPILGSPEHARMGLLAHILRTGYLWDAIRMKGGAYGASASVAGLEGSFTFSTYRDPVIQPSLRAFREGLEWAADALDDESVNLAVIGSVGKDLRPLGPGQEGAVAFKRRLYGITDEVRQTRRDCQLKADALSVREAARILLSAWDQRSISVISGAEALDSASVLCAELADSRIVLPA